MPTNYLPGLRVRPSVRLPSDGDLRNAASIQPALRTLADHAAYALRASAKNFDATMLAPLGAVRGFAEGFDPVAQGAPVTLALGSGGIARSEDGKSFWNLGRPGSYRGAAFSATLGLWVAVGQDLVTGSPSGGWTVRTVPVSTTLYDAAIGPAGDFVVVGDVGGDMATLLHSADGIVWTQREILFAGALYAVTHANGRWVAVGGQPGAPHIVTSENGLDWAEVFDVPGTAQPLVSLAWTGERFVALAQSGQLLSSETGLGFDIVATLPVTAAGMSVAADPETGIVAATAGDPGMVAFSFDGGATFPASERVRIAGGCQALGFAQGRLMAGGTGVLHAGLRR